LGIVSPFYLFTHCFGQSRKRSLNGRAQPLSPTDLIRLDAEYHHLWQDAAQRVGQRQHLAQAAVVEGEAVRRLSQPDLIRREADKLAWLLPNTGSVYHYGSLPSLQHLHQLQPAGTYVKSRRTLLQPPAGQFLHHPRADSIVTAQGITQAQD
jgi:hypothetical protein